MYQIYLFKHLMTHIMQYISGTLYYSQSSMPPLVRVLLLTMMLIWVMVVLILSIYISYYVFLRVNLISWYSKSQATPSNSSAEAKYQGIANAKVEYQSVVDYVVYCDIGSSVYPSCSLVKHQYTKHIEMDIHFMRDKVTLCYIKVFHVPFSYQYTNIFT